MSTTLDVSGWGLIGASEALTTKTSAQRGLEGDDGMSVSVSEYIVAVRSVDLPNPPRIVTVPVTRWSAASVIESQTTVARRYAPKKGVWLPPPAVVSSAVGEFEEAVTADPMALTAMDEAEQRLSAARDAEFDRAGEDRLYYRD